MTSRVIWSAAPVSWPDLPPYAFFPRELDYFVVAPRVGASIIAARVDGDEGFDDLAAFVCTLTGPYLWKFERRAGG